MNTTGFMVFNFSNALMFCSMLENPFFSSVVRIQHDRGQAVIKTGPYGVIRHPGYTSGILIAFIIRTYLKDKTLQNVSM